MKHHYPPLQIFSVAVFVALAFAFLSILSPVPVQANDVEGAYYTLDAKDTGVESLNISDTPVTQSIYMEDPVGSDGNGGHSNMLSLLVEVAWGTTTTFTISCEGGVNYKNRSSNTIVWGDIFFCDALAASTCEPDVRTYATTSKTSFWHHVASNYTYTRCTVTGTGTGVVTLKGIRGHQ